MPIHEIVFPAACHEPGAKKGNAPALAKIGTSGIHSSVGFTGFDETGSLVLCLTSLPFCMAHISNSSMPPGITWIVRLIDRSRSLLSRE